MNSILSQGIEPPTDPERFTTPVTIRYHRLRDRAVRLTDPVAGDIRTPARCWLGLGTAGQRVPPPDAARLPPSAKASTRNCRSLRMRGRCQWDAVDVVSSTGRGGKPVAAPYSPVSTLRRGEHIPPAPKSFIRVKNLNFGDEMPLAHGESSRGWPRGVWVNYPTRPAHGVAPSSASDLRKR